jgi:ABC-type multidrug transport system ATPase subunit
VRVKAENLVKVYGSGARALDRLSWELAPGQVVALLGPNGAGKTTLLNALAGCIRLDRGRVLFDGEVYTPDRTDLRKRFAFLPDFPPVPAGWSPLRFIGSVVKMYGRAVPDLEDQSADGRGFVGCGVVEISAALARPGLQGGARGIFDR